MAGIARQNRYFFFLSEDITYAMKHQRREIVKKEEMIAQEKIVNFVK
jgi:hypothetical protein